MGDTDQNHSKTPPHAWDTAIIKKDERHILVRMRTKGTVRNVNWYSH